MRRGGELGVDDTQLCERMHINITYTGICTYTSSFPSSIPYMCTYLNTSVNGTGCHTFCNFKDAGPGAPVTNLPDTE